MLNNTNDNERNAAEKPTTKKIITPNTIDDKKTGPIFKIKSILNLNPEPRSLKVFSFILIISPL